MNYQDFTVINGMAEYLAIPLISRFDMLSDAHENKHMILSKTKLGD